MLLACTALVTGCCGLGMCISHYVGLCDVNERVKRSMQGSSNVGGGSIDVDHTAGSATCRWSKRIAKWTTTFDRPLSGTEYRFTGCKPLGQRSLGQRTTEERRFQAARGLACSVQTGTPFPKPAHVQSQHTIYLEFSNIESDTMIELQKRVTAADLRVNGSATNARLVRCDVVRRAHALHLRPLASRLMCILCVSIAVLCADVGGLSCAVAECLSNRAAAGLVADPVLWL